MFAESSTATQRFAEVGVHCAQVRLTKTSVKSNTHITHTTRGCKSKDPDGLRDFFLNNTFVRSTTSQIAVNGIEIVSHRLAHFLRAHGFTFFPYCPCLRWPASSPKPWRSGEPSSSRSNSSLQPPSGAAPSPPRLAQDTEPVHIAPHRRARVPLDRHDTCQASFQSPCFGNHFFLNAISRACRLGR